MLDLPKKKKKDSQSKRHEEETCAAESGETCAVTPDNDEIDQQQQHAMEQDMATAAHYYRLAADKSGTPRAHYNLGFMYEWGLGVKQDFPLAKREYDLALSSAAGHQDVDLPVTVALWALSAHEYWVRLQMSWQDYYRRRVGDESRGTPSPSLVAKETTPMRAESHQAGRPVPSSPPHLAGKTKMGVILSHLFSWESLLILILTIVLSKLFQLRRTRR